MTERNKCTTCGSELPDSVDEGLCPACLLKRGLETNTVGFTDEDQAAAAKRWQPPSCEQLAPLFPELDILELIGRGGMGAVYKAREKQLDRLVALKILPPEIGREEAFAHRFAREAQAMAKLSHANIVTIHSFGSRGGEARDADILPARPEGVSPSAADVEGDSPSSTDQPHGTHNAGETPAPRLLYFFIMRDDDSVMVERWLKVRGFIIKPGKQSGKPSTGNTRHEPAHYEPAVETILVGA